ICRAAKSSAAQQSHLLHSKAVCCTAKSSAAQQSRLLHSKAVCCTAKSSAAQQSHLLHSKVVCCTAKSSAAQQSRLLHSKVICCTAKSSAAQQSRLLRSKVICCTAKPSARQQSRLLDSRTICRPAIAAAVQQMPVPLGKAFYRARDQGIQYIVRRMNPRIRAISGPLKGSEFFIGEADLKVGRGARNDVCVDDPLVSNKHCCLCFEYDRCLAWDCGSAHGTFVNEFSFPAKIVVHGDHLRIGRTVFVYLFHNEVDERLLELTETERKWVYSHYPPDRAGAYEPSKATTLAALLRMT